MTRGRVLVALSVVAASGACSLLTDLGGLGTDGGVDSSQPEAAVDDFALVVTPAHVTEDPGDSTDLSIAIIRGASFSDIVDVTVNGVGGLSGIQTTPAMITFTGSVPLTLHLDVAASAKVPQDGTITLLGIGRTTQKSHPTTFDVRIGSVLLDTRSNTTFTPPAYVKIVSIKAWGAGGAAGQDYLDSQNATGSGGSGGGGGFISAVFDVSNTGPLTIVVGTPGNSGGFGQRSSGSGGGYTSVSTSANVLLVAGGGGGGGSGGSTADNYCSAFAGGGGSAGGGGLPQGAKNSAKIDAGGARGDSTATAGSALQGGDGASAGNCGNCTFDGGTPGGGHGAISSPCAGAAGGGGGGGWFGGGGGGKWSPSYLSTTPNGGGGGSGFVSDAGADVSQLAGGGAAPGGANDPDYVAGSAIGGSGALPSTAGRVVIRTTKP